MTAGRIESGWAAINGANMHYRTAGDGPPLLLLHAAICDSRMWDDQIGEFARTHRVIAPDFRGFGRTKMVPRPFAHRHDLRALMDHLGVGRAMLMQHRPDRLNLARTRARHAPSELRDATRPRPGAASRPARHRAAA